MNAPAPPTVVKVVCSHALLALHSTRNFPRARDLGPWIEAVLQDSAPVQTTVRSPVESGARIVAPRHALKPEHVTEQLAAALQRMVPSTFSDSPLYSYSLPPALLSLLSNPLLSLLLPSLLLRLLL